MKSFAYKARLFLIRCGKTLPFIVCGLVCINWLESISALFTDNIIQWQDYAILYTPVSFFIGRYFEYNIQMLLVLCIISIAIETCYWNKFACFYLGINLLEKSYFNFELEPTYIYIICIVNIAVSSYLTYRGLKIIMKKITTY